MRCIVAVTCSAVGILMVSLALASPAWAQQATKSGSTEMPTAARAAHDLVFSLYPDLLSRPVAIEILPVAGSYAVRITDVPSSSEKASALPALVSALVSFDAAARLQTYSATGILLEGTRNQALRQQLAAHPEWNESDIDFYVQQISGRSRQDVLGVVRAAAESRAFLGTTATLDEAPILRGRPPVEATAAGGAAGPAFDSELRPGHVPPAPVSVVTPVWVVEATASDSTGENAHYRLEYEPIGGRLVRAVRQ